MSEQPINPEQNIGQQIDSDKKAFGDLYVSAFEARKRLELVPGWHHFAIEHPEYSKIMVSANAYDDMCITLVSNRINVGSSLAGEPYLLKKEQWVSRKAGGNLSYGAYDQISFKWRGDQGFDAELDTEDAEYDFTEPLAPEISALIDEMSKILPTLTRDQYLEEDSDWWPQEYQDDQYDRAKIRELNALEEALGTAGGAIYLLQLAFLQRRQELIKKGSNEAEQEFVLPRVKHSEFIVSADSDFEPRGTEWHPRIIIARKRVMNDQFRIYDGQLEHDETYVFMIGDDERIEYEVSDALDNEGYQILVGEYGKIFKPNEVLPARVQRLVKRLLKEIVNPDEQ